jgi:TPR repeat protein
MAKTLEKDRLRDMGWFKEAQDLMQQAEVLDPASAADAPEDADATQCTQCGELKVALKPSEPAAQLYQQAGDLLDRLTTPTSVSGCCGLEYAPAFELYGIFGRRMGYSATSAMAFKHAVELCPAIKATMTPNDCLNLGMHYITGFAKDPSRASAGITKDPSRAVPWLHIAAEAGLPAAQSQLAVRYFNGDGVAKDVKCAFEWNRKAAESGYPEGRSDLDKAYKAHLNADQH